LRDRPEGYENFLPPPGTRSFEEPTASGGWQKFEPIGHEEEIIFTAAHDAVG